MSADVDIRLNRLPQMAEYGEFREELQPKRTDVYLGMDANKARLFSLSLEQYQPIVFAPHGAIENEVPGIIEPVLFLTILAHTEDTRIASDGSTQESERCAEIVRSSGHRVWFVGES